MSRYKPPADRIPLSSPLYSRSEMDRINARARAILQRLKNIDVVTCDYDKRSARMIHGVASTGTTINGKSMLPGGCELVVPIPLLYEHSKHGKIGEVVRMQRNTKGEIYIHAIVYPGAEGDYVWEMIERGQLAGLSGRFVTGGYFQSKATGTKFYDRYQIVEISLTRSPKNLDCYFEILQNPDTPWLDW